MSVGLELILGSFVSLAVGLVASWLYRIGQARWRRWRGHAFWAAVADGQARLVVGRHEQPAVEPAGLLGIGDVRALVVLRDYLARLRLELPQVEYADEFAGKGLAGTVIVIGGPFANEQARNLWGQLATGWTFRADSPDAFAIVDRTTGQEHVPHRVGGEVDEDYALVVKAPNPLGGGDADNVFLFAGCYGYGTLAALRTATSDAFLRDARVSAEGGLECLLSTRVVNRAAQEARVLDIRHLPAP